MRKPKHKEFQYFPVCRKGWDADLALCDCRIYCAMLASEMENLGPQTSGAFSQENLQISAIARLYLCVCMCV